MDSKILARRIERQLNPAAEPRRSPPRVPDHDLVALIGQGSYGAVWLARSVTGGLHAVKVVWRSNFSNDRPYDREFKGIVQFEPISRSHPSVVTVLHVGRDEAADCFYYIMELADDAQASEPGAGAARRNSDPSGYVPRTLASDIRRRGRIPPGEVVALGVQLANALGHLHRHGLVHRDVKPSNVIFVDGHAQLADIGLVAGIDEARSFVGTEGFIPPEGPGTERADIFSLGRLLYEAATGRDRSEFPALPPDLDQWNPTERDVMLELNEVLARACAAQSGERHANAAELARDLNTILAGRSVRAAYAMEKRLRQATRLIAGTALTLLLAIVFVGFQRRQQQESEARAERETGLRRRAEAAERATEEQLYAALLEQGRATIFSGELGQRIRALEAVRRAAAISNSAALRGVAISALALPDLRFENTWPTGTNVTLLALDPSFKRIALARGAGPVEIYSISDHRSLAELPPSIAEPAYVGSWNADGRFLAVKRDLRGAGGLKADLEIWDMEKTQRILVVNNLARDAFSFHPQLPRLLAALSSGMAVVWDLTSAQPIARFHLSEQAALLKYSPDGERFALVQTSGDRGAWQKLRSEQHPDWTLSIHRAANGAKELERRFADAIAAMAWDPREHRIALADSAGVIQLMDPNTGETQRLGQHKDFAEVAAFTPDGSYLFTGGWDRELICWDTKAKRRAFVLGLDSYRVQFRTDGRECAVIRWPEGELKFFAFEAPLLYHPMEEDLGGRWHYAAFSSDGRWLAAGGGKQLGVWDLESLGPGALWRLVPEPWQSRVAFAENGDLYADGPGTCFRWRITKATPPARPCLTELPLNKPTDFTSLCLNGSRLVWTGGRGTALVSLDQPSSESNTWIPTSDGLNGVSPDGQWLAVFRGDTSQIYIYRLPAGQLQAVLKNERNIRRFEFSPSGQELAVACGQGVEFWSTVTWERTRRLSGFNGVLYSPDGRTLWLSSELRSAGLYDADTLELLLPLPASTIPLAVSPRGSRVAVSVDTGRVQVWNLEEVRKELAQLALDWR